MSSLRRAHAKLLCIVPTLVYMLPKRARSAGFLHASNAQISLHTLATPGIHLICPTALLAFPGGPQLSKAGAWGDEPWLQPARPSFPGPWPWPVLELCSFTLSPSSSPHNNQSDLFQTHTGWGSWLKPHQLLQCPQSPEPSLKCSAESSHLHLSLLPPHFHSLAALPSASGTLQACVQLGHQLSPLPGTCFPQGSWGKGLAPSCPSDSNLLSLP